MSYGLKFHVPDSQQMINIGPKAQFAQAGF
jgi:hypothetical protein